MTLREVPPYIGRNEFFKLIAYNLKKAILLRGSPVIP